MNCDTARILSEFSGRGELDSVEAGALEAHLADCPRCHSIVDQQRHVDDHVAAAMRHVPVPSGLRERILGGLEKQHRVERNRRLRKVGMALAACLLVGLSLWAYQAFRGRPAPNLDAYILETKPAVVEPGEVENWFTARYGREAVAPRDFDYSKLVHRDLADFQGKQVPMMLFVCHRKTRLEEARVYVLSSDDFDLTDLNTAAPSSGYKVEVRRIPDNTRLALVILFTGDSLDPFLLRDRRRTLTAHHFPIPPSRYLATHSHHGAAGRI